MKTTVNGYFGLVLENRPKGSARTAHRDLLTSKNIEEDLARIKPQLGFKGNAAMQVIRNHQSGRDYEAMVAARILADGRASWSTANWT